MLCDVERVEKFSHVSGSESCLLSSVKTISSPESAHIYSQRNGNATGSGVIKNRMLLLQLLVVIRCATVFELSMHYGGGGRA